MMIDEALVSITNLITGHNDIPLLNTGPQTSSHIEAARGQVFRPKSTMGIISINIDISHGTHPFPDHSLIYLQ